MKATPPQPGPPSGVQPRPDGSRRSLELILETITAGVLAIDAKGRISFANRAAHTALGYGLGDAVGRPIGSVISLFDDPSLSPRRNLGGREHRHETVIHRTADLPPRSVGLTVVAAAEPTADVDRVVLLRELGEVAAVESERRRIEQTAALARLVGGLAHELRNPLAAIQSLADGLLLEMPTGDPRLEYATRIIDAAMRMEDFVRAAVRFAQPIQSLAARCDAMDLLAAALELGQEGTVPATLRAADGTLHCAVDPPQVAECLAAILTNAREAARDHRQTQVRVARQTDEAGAAWVVFEVTDDGPGIPIEAHRRIFEPFYSTKPAKTGMGLAFAQRLASQNGGRVEVSSIPGQGSTFTLRLPEAR